MRYAKEGIPFIVGGLTLALAPANGDVFVPLRSMVRVRLGEWTSAATSVIAELPAA